MVAGRIADEDGSVILLDGHNRFEICQKNNIQYEFDILDFGNRGEALVWMINNQLGRRNLTPLQSSYLRGLRYNQEKAKTTNPDGRNQHGEVDYQNDKQPPTHARLAKKMGVSEATVSRDGKLAKAIESLVENAGPDIRQDILTCRAGLTRNDILLLAEELPPDEQRTLLARNKTEIKEVVKELKAKNNPRPKAEHDEPAEQADLKPDVVVHEDRVDPGVDSTPESGPQIEDADQVQVKTIGYANLDEMVLMRPDEVAQMITTGPPEFIRAVAHYLNKHLEKYYRDDQKAVTSAFDLSDTADQVPA